MEWSQKKTDIKLRNNSFVCLLFHTPNTEDNWLFVIEYTFLLHCIYLWNHLEPFCIYIRGRFQMEPFHFLYYMQVLHALFHANYYADPIVVNFCIFRSSEYVIKSNFFDSQDVLAH